MRICFSLSIILAFCSICSFGQQKRAVKNAENLRSENNDYLIAFSDTTIDKELFGYKTRSGQIVIPPKYRLFQATDTLFKTTMVYSDSGWIVINRNDSILLKPFIYDNGPDYIEEGLYRFVEYGKIGFANEAAEKIIPAMFDFVTPFENGIAEYTLGGAKVMDGEHWFWSGGYAGGYVSRSGQLYKEVQDIKNKKREAWTIANKHVLLDKNGNIIQVLKK